MCDQPAASAQRDELPDCSGDLSASRMEDLSAGRSADCYCKAVDG